MTLEQARRLKEAGFPLKRCPYYHSPSGECEGLQVKCPENTDDDCWFKTEEKEMMEFLKKKLIRITIHGELWVFSFWLSKNKWDVVSDKDLTEALVQACEAVCKGKEAR